MAAYAARKIPNVSFLTNAFYIDEDLMDSFIENKLSYIAVSFDGIGPTYEAVRRPAAFEESFNKLALLQEKKKLLGARLPQVRLCTIWPAVKHNPGAYYETMKPVSDYIVCNPYINFRGPMSHKEDFVCQYPWERMVIAFDGEAQCCTGWNADDIILGNLNATSIATMWRSQRMQTIRKLHREGSRMALNSCARCRHGCEGDPDADIRDIIHRGY
jgi:radical SAM protein with 4Fe4S-binding SPASM domain